MRIVVGTGIYPLNQKHIKRWVEFHSQYADKLVVAIDEPDRDFFASDVAWIEEKGVHIVWFAGDEHMGKQNKMLRAIQSFRPDWMGHIAVDEIFTPNFLDHCDNLLLADNVRWYSFPVCHLWGDERHCRVDGWWSAALTNIPENKKIWRNVYPDYDCDYQGLHSSLVPFKVRVDDHGLFLPDIQVLHYAFLDPSDWKKRCDYFGPEYEFGGDKSSCEKSDGIILVEITQ